MTNSPLLSHGLQRPFPRLPPGFKIAVPGYKTPPAFPPISFWDANYPLLRVRRVSRRVLYRTGRSRTHGPPPRGPKSHARLDPVPAEKPVPQIREFVPDVCQYGSHDLVLRNRWLRGSFLPAPGSLIYLNFQTIRRARTGFTCPASPASSVSDNLGESAPDHARRPPRVPSEPPAQHLPLGTCSRWQRSYLSSFRVSLRPVEMRCIHFIDSWI